MKLQPRTMQILKNFAATNPTMWFVKGHHQVTMHPMKKSLIRAVIEEEIPADFGIIDLSKFIGTLSLFSEPQVEIDKKYVVISEGGQKVNYTIGEPDLIVKPSAKSIKLQSEDVKFKLTDTMLSQLMKASGVLNLPHFVIYGDGEKVFVGVDKCDDPSANKMMIEAGITDKRFKLVISIENFRLLSGTYDVTASKGGLVHFAAKDIEYWLTTEPTLGQFN